MSTVWVSSAPRLLAPSVTLGPPVSRRSEPKREELRLVAGLRRRDPDALQSLYREYGATTFGLLRRLLGDHQTAEDVQQQVYLEVWQRAPDYDPRRASLLTWIMQIVRSRAIDQLRRRVPEPHDPGAVALTDDGDDGRAIDELLEQWRVVHLLRGLPTEEAAILRMRFEQDLTQREIAERTGLPLGTVKTRMVSALKRLREMIEREEAAA